ncbi:hypothetical protein G4Y79_11050 [Phototrophicus methaneseepsis]|uniref:Uncharacterized protein n=1 Tax=Phototrophicus methaneseepsis TaxID=2710758 RepID=A0A7S8EDB5_9CHLR|nr:hypothetical protein [Phototrophicus methaneseepsis]QPC84877.1 hypothetical protein G4Y79_11050 [Phototrophicus methaneseepsis]
MNTETQPDIRARRRNRLWLNIALLIGLIVVLFLLDAFYTSLNQQTTVLAGEPGNLLYAAGFDGFEDEWQQSTGRDAKEIIDGAMQISVESSATIYSAVDPTFADFDVSVDATPIDGSEANEGYGIVFRLQEPATTCNMPLRILCDISTVGIFSTLNLLFPPTSSTPTSYAVFLISNDGYYSLWHTDESGQAVKATIWHYSDGLINEGLDATNRVRVVGIGNDFRFFINGEQVTLCVPNPGEQPTGSATDCQGEETQVWHATDIAPTGKLGVVVNTDRYPGSVIAFDAFVVYSPGLSDNAESA